MSSLYRRSDTWGGPIRNVEGRRFVKFLPTKDRKAALCMKRDLDAKLQLRIVESNELHEEVRPDIL